MSEHPVQDTESISARLARIRAEERQEKLAQVVEDAERDARLALLLASEGHDRPRT